MASANGLRIKGRDYSIDDLTLEEVDEIEELCDAALEDLDLRRAKTIRAVVYVLLKRDEPELTLEEVGKVKVAELMGDGTSAA